MTDFFISYTGADTAWAEWMGFVLEEAGFSVVIQAWDFRPGSNFVLAMQKAASEADRTIMVLSPEYLKSQFASPEWAAAFAQDPQGLEQRLVPVQVRPCEPKGLLTSIVQIRIAGRDEATASRTLLDGVAKKRAKPSKRPTFPGNDTIAPEQKPFPGAKSDPVASPGPSGLIPSLKRAPSDIEKRRYARQGFETIKTLFEANLTSVSEQESRIETDLAFATATDFRAEIFMDGKSRCTCRIWQGGMHSADNICYSEQRHAPDGSCNEIIALAQNGELQFTALMASVAFGFGGDIDLKKLDAYGAADYLWKRFVSPLGH